MNVSFSKAAAADVNGTAIHLAEQAGETVANEFLLRAEERITMLASFPESGRRSGRPGVRVMLVPGFPYLIMYRLVGASELRVLRVRHAHRRPLTS